MTRAELIRKFNVPGPRYTSYPTVPYWDKEGISPDDWKDSLVKTFIDRYSDGISLYVHLPFCESLCTFCGCHKRITKRHEVEEPYIDTLLKEWQLYLDILPLVPQIKEIHLGGGTPTFFSPENLRKLIHGILEGSELPEDYTFSFEGHPNNTSKQHLKDLYDLGFRRVSFGVQDYSLKVQMAINRVQPFEQVEKVHNWSREIGYTSVNHDLVFGLPHQKKESVRETIEKTNKLRPDRIAYYSYAHVPWIKGVGQRGFDENDLPRDEEKRELYEIGKSMFDENGYVEIGMDHFALKSDSLAKAMKSRKLHRNFMGYTTTDTRIMVGLGMSAISDSWLAFAQNEKKVEDYQARIAKGKLAVFRGHLLNREDLMLRKQILNVMCNFETVFPGDEQMFDQIKGDLSELETHGLVQINGRKIKVPPDGVPFVRNVCMAFDRRLKRSQPKGQLFSKTV